MATSRVLLRFFYTIKAPRHKSLVSSSFYCSSRLTRLVPYSCLFFTNSCAQYSTIRHYSNDKVKEYKKEGQQESVLMEVLSKDEPKELTVGAKVVQAGKDFTYLIAIVAGFGIVGLLFYYVTSEFFSTSSPSYIFSKALKRVKADERVKEALGEPISGYGETSSRGRRRDLNYLEYEVEGVTFMRMKFNLSGSKRKGEAVLDLKKNEHGKYELRFLFVELVGYPPKTLVLEDNR